MALRTDNQKRRVTALPSLRVVEATSERLVLEIAAGACLEGGQIRQRRDGTWDFGGAVLYPARCWGDGEGAG